VKEISRRQFVGATASIAIHSLAGRSAHATPLDLPLAIQLYSVRQQMAEDLDGAFAAISAAGYTEVEAALLPKRSAKEIRAALARAGLRCVGAHHGFADLNTRFDETVAYDRELGVRFIICASPGYRTPSPSGTLAAKKHIRSTFTSTTRNSSTSSPRSWPYRIFVSATTTTPGSSS
jgi:hypothetical protein